MKTEQPIIFFASDKFGVPTLLSLIKNNYKPELVITIPDKPAGRDLHITMNPIKDIAKKYNLAILQPQKITDIKTNIQSLRPNIGILISYGALIPKDIIQLFTLGIINLHPSLLPKYRGSSPIEAAIINNDKKTGVSLIKLTDKLDAGPIYAQSTLKLKGKETQYSLTKDLSNICAQILIQYFPKILNNKIVPIMQNNKKATFSNKLQKKDGLLIWNNNADMIERQIRAYQIWPKSYGKILDYDVIVTKAHVVNKSGPTGEVKINKDNLIIYCKNNAISIDRIIPCGKKEMDIKAFIRGRNFKY